MFDNPNMATSSPQSTTNLDSGQQESSQATPIDSSKDKLTSYLEDERFSRTFVMPAEDGEDSSFTVTYSDYGHREETHPENERVLLFCGPLLGR